MSDEIKLAREAFDLYAAMDAPRVPSDSLGEGDVILALSDLQVRLARWQVRNFGIASDLQIALGVAEEAGELAHATLKRSQMIRGMEDLEAYRAAAGDAIADIVIYAIQMSTNLRLDFGTLVEQVAERVLRRDWKKDAAAGGEQ
jgi:NTP pyrophosphatase (non-canonical NTP hydrolase)